MVILCLLVGVEEDAPRRKSATIFCWMDETSRNVAIWRSQRFDDFHANTRAELLAFLGAVRITKDLIEYMEILQKSALRWRSTSPTGAGKI
jgi:hypothetical protein